MENNIQVEPKRNAPRDVFLHLLAMITLFSSATSFITLIWQFIDKLLPDALSSSYYYSSYADSFSAWVIKFSISTIIITFPIFILVSWYLNKIYRREAVARESKIRKWLIYLTLFFASLFIIGDLIDTINTFLGGSITESFILKALLIIFVAVVIFIYYLNDVTRDTPSKYAKYFAWVSSILVLAAIVTGFFVVGTPATARLINFDQQKITDLQNIQSQVVNYYQRKGVLPSSLSALNDSISGYSVPTDPQPKDSYEYDIKDTTNLSFELCASFNESSSKENAINNYPVYPVGSGINQNWDHMTGSVCFERTIDKQLYPLLNSPVPANLIPVK